MLEWEHVPARLGPQAPGWAAQENGKETRLWPIEWGSIYCSCVRSPTPSYTQHFQIKWEVYFSKNCVARLCCVFVFCMHAYVDVYVLCVCIVGHGYTAVSQGKRKWLSVVSNKRKPWWYNTDLVCIRNMHCKLLYYKKHRKSGSIFFSFFEYIMPALLTGNR